jgi:hypothetical protein
MEIRENHPVAEPPFDYGHDEFEAVFGEREELEAV